MAADDVMKAFIELQNKLNESAALSHAAQQQVQRARISSKRTELTLEQLSQLSDNVPVYRQVGKAYFLTPMNQIKDELNDDTKASQEELKKYVQQQERAAKAAKATEDELKELMKAHPEIVRQLAAI